MLLLPSFLPSTQQLHLVGNDVRGVMRHAVLFVLSVAQAPLNVDSRSLADVLVHYFRQAVKNVEAAAAGYRFDKQNEEMLLDQEPAEA